MSTITLTLHEDAAHGWIECPKSLLTRLGIEREITFYSYMDGGLAYLEEDCDAPRLLAACKAAGIEVELVRRYADRTPIRDMGAYRPPDEPRHTYGHDPDPGF